MNNNVINQKFSYKTSNRLNKIENLDFGFLTNKITSLKNSFNLSYNTFYNFILSNINQSTLNFDNENYKKTLKIDNKKNAVIKNVYNLESFIQFFLNYLIMLQTCQTTIIKNIDIIINKIKYVMNNETYKALTLKSSREEFKNCLKKHNEEKDYLELSIIQTKENINDKKKLILNLDKKIIELKDNNQILVTKEHELINKTLKLEIEYSSVYTNENNLKNMYNKKCKLLDKLDKNKTTINYKKIELVKTFQDENTKLDNEINIKDNELNEVSIKEKAIQQEMKDKQGNNKKINFIESIEKFLSSTININCIDKENVNFFKLVTDININYLDNNVFNNETNFNYFIYNYLNSFQKDVKNVSISKSCQIVSINEYYEDRLINSKQKKYLNINKFINKYNLCNIITKSNIFKEKSFKLSNNLNQVDSINTNIKNINMLTQNNFDFSKKKTTVIKTLIDENNNLALDFYNNKCKFKYGKLLIKYLKHIFKKKSNDNKNTNKCFDVSENIIQYNKKNSFFNNLNSSSKNKNLIDSIITDYSHKNNFVLDNNNILIKSKLNENIRNDYKLNSIIQDEIYNSFYKNDNNKETTSNIIFNSPLSFSNLEVNNQDNIIFNSNKISNNISKTIINTNKKYLDSDKNTNNYNYNNKTTKNKKKKQKECNLTLSDITSSINKLETSYYKRSNNTKKIKHNNSNNIISKDLYDIGFKLFGEIDKKERKNNKRVLI